jgi:hypothetical protein
MNCLTVTILIPRYIPSFSKCLSPLTIRSAFPWLAESPGREQNPGYRHSYPERRGSSTLAAAMFIRETLDIGFAGAPQRLTLRARTCQETLPLGIWRHIASQGLAEQLTHGPVSARRQFLGFDQQFGRQSNRNSLRSAHSQHCKTLTDTVEQDHPFLPSPPDILHFLFLPPIPLTQPHCRRLPNPDHSLQFT